TKKPRWRHRGFFYFAHLVLKGFAQFTPEAVCRRRVVRCIRRRVSAVVIMRIHMVRCVSITLVMWLGWTVAARLSVTLLTWTCLARTLLCSPLFLTRLRTARTLGPGATGRLTVPRRTLARHGRICGVAIALPAAVTLALVALLTTVTLWTRGACFAFARVVFHGTRLTFRQCVAIELGLVDATFDQTLDRTQLAVFVVGHK